MYDDGDTGKSLLMDVPHLHTCFIPSGVGSRPGALSEQLVTTLTCLKRQLTTTWNFLHFVTSKKISRALSCFFWQGESWAITWAAKHLSLSTMTALNIRNSFCEEDWQGESREHCSPFYLKRGYWSLINCKGDHSRRRVFLTFFTVSVKCVGYSGR